VSRRSWCRKKTDRGRLIFKGYFQWLRDEAGKLTSLSGIQASGLEVDSITPDFPELFSKNFVTARCAAYEIELSDTTPVHSPPYRCAPPKAAIFRRIVDDLLEQGVIRPSKSPYAIPAFLVPQSGGDFRMVVDYRKVNVKVLFDSYPMPTIEQAFE